MFPCIILRTWKHLCIDQWDHVLPLNHPIQPWQGDVNCLMNCSHSCPASYPPSHLPDISTSSSSEFHLGSDHVLVTSFYNSSESRFLADPTLHCKLCQNHSEDIKKKKKIKEKRKMKEEMGTTEQKRELVTSNSAWEQGKHFCLQQLHFSNKDFKLWLCHSPFFSTGNNPTAQVKPNARHARDWKQLVAGRAHACQVSFASLN